MTERTTGLTPEREQEIRETHPGDWYSGPWTQDYVDGNGDDQPDYNRVVHHESGTVLATLPDFAGPLALFIADAHDAVPELLAEIDRLRAEVTAERIRALTQAARVLDEVGDPLGAEEVRRLAAPPTQGPEQEEEAAETDEQRADRLETERHHAAGDHEYCGPTCEVAFPSEALRNTILYRAIPGSPRMLDELLRRAREQGDADLATILVDDEEGIDGPCDCGEGAVHYTAADCPFEQRRQAGGVTVTPEEYTVTAVPDEVSPDAHLWALKVRHRGGGRWAVQHGEHECLGADGEWAQGVKEYDRGDEWLAAHRFGLETALDLAREAAPHVTVNGLTVAGVLARKQGSAE